jgi:hypothetical protein
MPERRSTASELNREPQSLAEAAAETQSEPSTSAAVSPPAGPSKAQPETTHQPEALPRESAGASEPAVSAQLRAREAERFYSRLLAGKDPAGKDPDTHPENLSFDFADEEPAFDQPQPVSHRRRQQTPSREPQERFSDRWEVGDDEPSIAAQPIKDAAPFAEESEPPPHFRKAEVPQTEELEFSPDTEFVDEREAPIYNHARTHSARFFLLMALLVGVGFGTVTVLIHNGPASAAIALGHLPFVGDRFVIPATPARLVALRDVSAVYERSKDARNALVISGSAENVGMNSLRVVQLTAALRDPGRHSLAAHAVYCGNDLSTAMVSQMTPHEIEFFQKLEPPRTFSLQPLASCRFVVVFVEPPNGVSAYDVSVSQAVTEVPATAAEPAS